jgi:hypothetical protein
MALCRRCSIVNSEALQHNAMRERRFKDANGTEWRAYVVIMAPKVAPFQQPMSAQFRPVRSSLAFDSENERRRLTPAPFGWEDAAPAELERLLHQAMTVTIRLAEPPRPSGSQ